MTLTRRGFVTGTTVLTSAVLAGVAVTPSGVSAAAPLSVVATTGMIADTAAVIGGELVTVRGLMGPGVDPHSYRQTRTDILALSRADLVLFHGLRLEAQMTDFLADLSRKRSVVSVAEGIDPASLRADETYADAYDPHVWMDPTLWGAATLAVRDALIAALPDHADALTARADAYLADLADLDAYARQVLGSVPEQARVLVTAHDAFGYFGQAYGFEVLGIQGISTEAEAGLNRIGILVDTLVARKIQAVFVESSVSDRNIRALIEGAGAQGQTVAIGGALYSDAMGAEGTYEGTYLGMIDHNITTIAAALGGTVPPAGRLGNLSAGL